MNRDKKFAKSWLPPIILSKLNLLRANINFKKYKKITSKNSYFLNKNNDKRCFILGSGTSIKSQKLELLKDEIVISLNNFFVHPQFNKIMTGDFPKYHLVAPIHEPQTEDEWTKWFIEMDKKIPTSVILILGITRTPVTTYEIISKNNLFQNHNVYWYYSGINPKHYNFIFQKEYIDITKPVLSADAASIYALIFAIYTGVENIYLLGMDHDYFLHDDESKMRFYKNAKHQKDELKRTYGDSFYVKEFLRQYSIFSLYEMLSNYSSSKIFNASAGGILKVFKKVNFEDLFTKK